MFQFAGLASAKGRMLQKEQVFLFGDLRINAYLQLPAAYRSLTRPSSPLRA